jgi:hypothetical protein
MKIKRIKNLSEYFATRYKPVKVKVKVKQSRYSPEVAQRVPEI